MPFEFRQWAERRLGSWVLKPHLLHGSGRFRAVGGVGCCFGPGFGGRFIRRRAHTDVSPGDLERSRALVNAVKLESDVAARMSRVTFRRDGGDDHFLPVDPGGHLISHREDPKPVPLAALEELVIAPLVLGRQPLAPTLAEDVAGEGSAFRVLSGDVHLRTFQRTGVPAGKLPNAGADLHARIQVRIDQLDLELELEVAVFRVGAKEGGSQSFRRRPDDGAVLHLERAALVALGPAVDVFAVEQRNPIGFAESELKWQQRREEADAMDHGCHGERWGMRKG